MGEIGDFTENDIDENAKIVRVEKVAGFWIGKDVVEKLKAGSNAVLGGKSIQGFDHVKSDLTHISLGE